MFESLLEGRVDPDNAAGTIASTYEPLLKRDSKLSPVAAVWGILCDAVRAFGGDREHSERMSRLLSLISKLPDVMDEDGNAITPVMFRNAGDFWRDLPEFTLMFREYAIDIEDEDEIEGGDWAAPRETEVGNLCKTDYDRIDAGPQSGFPSDNGDWLWGKGRGYSLGRWTFWKKRFSELGTSQEMSESAKDICGRASSEMERVKASSQHH